MPRPTAHWISLYVGRDSVNPDNVWAKLTFYYQVEGHKARTGRSWEKSFLHPQPLSEVFLTFQEALHTMDISASVPASDAGPSTPGRERSGFENVPLPLALPSELPPEQAATTPEPAP